MVVCCLGAGEIAPVGPTCFEFCVPEDSPISISPTVGCLMPGSVCSRISSSTLLAYIRKEFVLDLIQSMEHYNLLFQYFR